ncbi:rhamnulokinase [Mycolicibacterium sp.]|uniref:rhamnulokinase n=1 Tax=Mycolicibacterium sp. TaxID=2320850 RepID=UPI003D14F742
MSQIAAIDLGATSGRVILATVGRHGLELEQVARFPNDPVYLWNGHRTAMHWELPGLFRAACDGLAEAARQSPKLVAVAVDSWAVDYGLLRDGRLLGQPYHYRDDRCLSGVETVHATVDQPELYRRNGLQFLPFTTLYQLAAEERLPLADRALLIPDLIGYWLTGRQVTERTNASTTGLLGVDGVWDRELCGLLGIPADLFPDVVDPGTELGPVLPDLADALGLDSATSVTTTASHDTASAVVAVPMDATSAAYISCGTWGLVGVELSSPVLSDAGRQANFTNEVGADGRIRYLHNIMGLWVLSETIRQFERDGYRADLIELLAQAADVPSLFDVFDTADPRFATPGDMPHRIRAWYDERGLQVPMTRPELVRVIVESLAAAFAQGVHRAAELSGVPVRTAHIVGGGSQNRLLCQLIADRLGMPVYAGPVEATALGNVLITARAHGLVEGDLEALRHRVAASFPTQRYVPRPSRRTSRTMTKAAT